MTKNAINVEAVNKTFGEGQAAYQALKDVHVQIDQGEFVFLVGPSGSGKTTLLSIIGCVLRATSGHVTLLGEEISGATEDDLARLRLAYVGFIFQGHNLLSSLSAEENIVVILALRGFSIKDARIEARRLLTLVGIGDKSASLPASLSIGQSQRVAIARALAGNPPIILADEPTASLDAENGKLVIELLKDLASNRGHTVIVVTHDDRIFKYAERLIYIEDGKIQEANHGTAI